MSSHSDLLFGSDPDFSSGKGTFNFPNGDKYVGEYCAHRTGIVWRQGVGTYTTNEKQIYTGFWKDDKLVENRQVEILYPNGVQYQGCIVKNRYDGPGTYVFENKMMLLCEFADNKPTGEITLIDFKGREWHGVATPNDDALLFPEHIYYNNINDITGKGSERSQSAKLRKRSSRRSEIMDIGKNYQARKSRTKSLIQVKPSKSLVMTQSSKVLLVPQDQTKNVRRQSKPSIIRRTSKPDAEKNRLNKEEVKIFAKTKKTASDLQFENSDWYKNYVNFKGVYDSIMTKINKHGEQSLDEGESKWYKKYQKFKEKYHRIMAERECKQKDLLQEELFELYNSEELKNKCPPVKVVYPTGDCDSVCECESVKE